VAVLTLEIHPSPVAVSFSMLLILSTPELLQFTDGISACGERFNAAMTHVLVRPECVSVSLLRTSPKRSTLSLITHVDVERHMHISG
jgi:hypothetical protein